MSEGKIELTLGALSFSAEGEQEWLGDQLDKILEVAPTMANSEPAVPATDTDADIPPSNGDQKAFSVSLASHLKAKGDESNQTKRFLSTADWLRQRGSVVLQTGMISKALRENQQSRLTNSANCLNHNVARGFCEKNSQGFFITPEGLKALGY